MKKNLPLVTVVVLTYRKFESLEQTIQSVYSQDYPNIELIISDDGSDNYDKSYIQKCCENRTVNIKELKLIHLKKNLGTVKNLNNCIKVSNGKYFIPLASDDIFYQNNTISELVDYFEDTGALIVTGKRFVFDHEANRQIEVLPVESDLRYLSDDQVFLYERLCYGNFISGASTYYSKQIFDKYGLFDESYILLEDYPLYLKLARNREKIYLYDGITIKYQLGGVSTFGNIHPLLKKDYLKTLENEILSHRECYNKKMLNWKLSEHIQMKNNYKFTFKLLKHPVIFTKKVLNKLNIVQIRPENFINRGRNQ